VAGAVVDQLETVKIEHRQRHRQAGAPGACQLLRCRLSPAAPVEESREIVDRCLLLQPARV
jgi:hypothetical protein